MKKSSLFFLLISIIITICACSNEENTIALNQTLYEPATSLPPQVDTTKCFVYNTCNFNHYIIDIYRNSQSTLVVSATDSEGNISVLTTYEDWKHYCFEDFESSLSKNNYPRIMSSYNNLFGAQALKIELPIGANANLYIIIGEQNNKPELLLQTIDSGLIIDDIDFDYDTELISCLGGYFYDCTSEKLYIYHITLPENILQAAWNSKKHKMYIYYKDRTLKNGHIDIENLQLVIEE